MSQWKSELHNQSDSVPTLKAWLRGVSGEQLEKWHIVKVIWLPNKFPSLTLEVESFRLRLSESDFLYSLVEETIDEWEENRTVLALQPQNKRGTEVILSTLDDERCDWEPLGDFGWKAVRIERADKKRASRKPGKQSPQTPPEEEVASEPA